MPNIHAREVATPELAIRYIKYLTSGYDGEGGYGVDPDVTWLVNHNVVYVLVSQNPDGRVVNEADTGAYRRKNMNNDPCPTGEFGIDLNRNHSFLWGCCGGSSGDPCGETYRGASQGSEPETQAFQTYFASVIPDQNGPNDDTTIAPASPVTTTGIFLSLHSYADEVLWPWCLPAIPARPTWPSWRRSAASSPTTTAYDPTGTSATPSTAPPTSGPTASSASRPSPLRSAAAGPAATFSPNMAASTASTACRAASGTRTGRPFCTPTRSPARRT